MIVNYYYGTQSDPRRLWYYSTGSGKILDLGGNFNKISLGGIPTRQSYEQLSRATYMHEKRSYTTELPCKRGSRNNIFKQSKDTSVCHQCIHWILKMRIESISEGYINYIQIGYK